MKKSRIQTVPAAIGNGLYVRQRRASSLLEQYRSVQASCAHEKRDPRGTCYRCGDRSLAEWVEGGSIT